MRAPDEKLVGVVLAGRYRITRVLAAGGMGAVYEAEQLGLGRSVAVKVVHPFLGEDVEALARFEREARVVAAIGHPNVVQIYDFHRAPGEMAWIVMELARGRSLAQVLRDEGALPPERVGPILLSLLSALDAAHATGVVHRDLKPGNVMVASVAGVGETAKLLDFGIAKLIDGAGYTKLTQTGVAIGTPQFMAPEQAMGETIDARTDLYAVGVMCWAMLAGKLPFPRGSMADVLEGVLHTTPPPPSTLRPGIPPSLDAFVARGMAKSPAARYQSAREMADALRASLSPASDQRSASVVPATHAPTPLDADPHTRTSGPPSTAATRPPDLVSPAPAPDLETRTLAPPSTAATRPPDLASPAPAPAAGTATHFPASPIAVGVVPAKQRSDAIPLAAPRTRWWPVALGLAVGCAGLGGAVLLITGAGGAWLVLHGSESAAAPTVQTPAQPPIQPAMPSPIATAPLPPPTPVAPIDAGPPYDVTQGTMQRYLTEATVIARGIAADARLMLVLGICIDRTGHVGAAGGADCGWKIQFVRAGGPPIVIEFGRMQTAPHVGGDVYEPTAPPLDADVLPDSDVVTAAAFASRGCARLDAITRVVWRQLPGHGDGVIVDSHTVHDWAAEIRDGRLRPRFQDCRP